MVVNVYNIAYLILIVWVIAEIFVSKWVLGLKPPKAVRCKYGRWVLARSVLAFGSGWKKEIETTDLDIFVKYQFSMKMWLLSLSVPFLILAYLFFFSMSS